MAQEIMKWRHLPLAAVLALTAWYITQRFGSSLLGPSGHELPDVLVFFLVALPAVGCQYLENRFLWSKTLQLDDNLSFMGISMGIGVGLIILLTGLVAWPSAHGPNADIDNSPTCYPK